MPYVHDGIGTWYYGKRRIHRIKDVCEFCHRAGELQSYDTTLYFVVFMVPLIPLGQKRILRECPSCSKHRALGLREWETAKAKDAVGVLEKLAANPDDRETIVQSLNLAMGYQDQNLLDQLASSVAQHKRDDAVVQSQLGAAYSYFARYPEAEAACRAALAVEDTPPLQRQLAVILLRMGRPQDAYPYLLPILDNKEKDAAGLIYLLIESFQAQGLHREALALIDLRDQTFPDLAALADCQRQRKVSERHQHTGKKVASAYLTESAQAGYREGNWTALIPRLIGPLVVLGLLAWWFGAAWWIGQARTVYLVNGWDRPYTVAVNGIEHTLAAGVATPVRVAEGDVAVEMRQPAGREPDTCRLASGFFGRPFWRHTFVINPDRLAVLVRETAEYSEVPRPLVEEPQYKVGDVQYHFTGLDYEFAPFPDQLKASKGSTIIKRRVALVTGGSPQGRMQTIAEVLDDKQQLDYVRRWLQLDPNDSYFLAVLLSRLPPEEALQFLEPHLATRPILVECHRAYQHLMDTKHPERDLRPDYEKLVTETDRHADALYLLGRVADVEEAVRLFQQAAAANPPSVRSQHALGFRALGEGEFAEAVRWLEKVTSVEPHNPVARRDYWSALLAAGQFDRLLEALRARGQQPEERFAVLIEQLRVCTAKGDKEGAQAAIQEALAQVPGPEDNPARAMLEAGMQLIRCSGENDAAGLIKACKQAPNFPRFEPALLEGKLAEAARQIDSTDAEQRAARHGLIYVAAARAGDDKLADAEWQQLLTALAKGDRYQRQLGEMLAGKWPITADAVRHLPIDVRQKRVLLVAAVQRYPNLSKDLMALARKLNFQRDPMSLCLRKVLDEAKPAN